MKTGLAANRKNEMYVVGSTSQMNRVRGKKYMLLEAEVYRKINNYQADRVILAVLIEVELLAVLA